MKIEESGMMDADYRTPIGSGATTLKTERAGNDPVFIPNTENLSRERNTRKMRRHGERRREAKKCVEYQTQLRVEIFFAAELIEINSADRLSRRRGRAT